MVSKFSDWLLDCGFKHELTEVKGGWIISFTNPPPSLISLIKSTVIPIPDGTGGIIMVKSFTTSGDIVIEEQYTAEILNALYREIRNYSSSIARKSLG